MYTNMNLNLHCNYTIFQAFLPVTWMCVGLHILYSILWLYAVKMTRAKKSGQIYGCQQKQTRICVMHPNTNNKRWQAIRVLTSGYYLLHNIRDSMKIQVK